MTCRLTTLGASTALALTLTSCSQLSGAPDAAPGEAMDVSHVHALAVDPEDPGRVYIATHEGLGAWSAGGLTRISERPDDFMGMTVGPGGVLLGSGHPGAGVLGRSHLGLITSPDGGRTWESLSLSGEADFHALVADEDGFVGYDAANKLLRSSPDGQDWEDREAPTGFLDLAADPTSPRVYGTSGEGQLVVSDDGGLSVEPVPDAPRLLLVEVFPDGSLLGVGTDGALLAQDADGTWSPTGAGAGDGLAALTIGPDDTVWLLDGDGLQRSTDRGASLEVVPGW